MNNIVSIKNLTISFKNNKQVVNDANLDIPKDKTVAIVGESGSGKTLTALSVLKLLPSGAKIDQGQIIFNTKDLLKLLEYVGSGLTVTLTENQASVMLRKPKDLLTASRVFCHLSVVI